MITIQAQNVNVVFPLGIHMLLKYGEQQGSQHGATLEMPQPVSVCYENPRERCLFDPVRDSNPFLNLFEALWILAGRNDVAFLQPIVGRMATYSDDGVTYYGAYGHRMRFSHTPDHDQIEEAIQRLVGNPNDRQVVLTIRRARDMFYYGKDQPCNLMAALKIRGGKLNMHVFNRSNDFVWGMTGTNVVQFSMLQEYIAGRIGVPVGQYHQTTDSMHVYTNEQWDKVKDACRPVPVDRYDKYSEGTAIPFPMMAEPEKFERDLFNFFQGWDVFGDSVQREYESQFFQQIVEPMWQAFIQYKDFRDNGNAVSLEAARMTAATMLETHLWDWGVMATEWLGRRGQK